MAALRAVDIEYAAIEPHDLEAEQAVVGACLSDREAIVRLASLLSPDDFFIAANRVIYRAIVALYHRRVPADLLTVAAELRSRRELEAAQGETYLAHVVGSTPVPVHAEHYASVVREHAQRRRLIHAAQRMVTHSFDTRLPLPDVLASADAAYQEALVRSSAEGYLSMGEAVSRSFDNLGAHREPPIETGFYDLDRLIGGFRPGQLVIPAGRPANGKSVSGIQMAASVAKRGIPAGIITIEMTTDEVLDRVFAFTAGVDMHAVRVGRDEEGMARVVAKMGMVATWPLYIDDRSNATLTDVLARARSMIAEAGVRFLVIDYLQLISDARRGDNRVQEVSRISRAFKVLAREHRIVVVALAQVSRAIESRGSDRTPRLSDLRESGSLEQDSDIVIFIHRPDEYDDNAEKGVAEFIVAKHRNGPRGVVKLRFDAIHTQFLSWGFDGE